MRDIECELVCQVCHQSQIRSRCNVVHTSNANRNGEYIKILVSKSAGIVPSKLTAQSKTWPSSIVLKDMDVSLCCRIKRKINKLKSLKLIIPLITYLALLQVKSAYHYRCYSRKEAGTYNCTNQRLVVTQSVVSACI